MVLPPYIKKRSAIADRISGVDLDANAALAEAYCDWNAGQLAEAGNRCREILAGDPTSVPALSLMALIAARQGDATAAISYMNRAEDASLVPASDEPAIRKSALSSDGLSPVWHSLALSFIAARKLDEARLCLERLIAKEPKNAEARNNLGIALQNLGEYGLAEREYRMALEIDPRNASIHANLAAVLGSLGDYADSISHAQQAIDIDPGFATAHVLLALAESGRERHHAALDAIDRGLSHAPENLALLVMRAALLLKVYRPTEALAGCRHVLALDPKNAEAHEIFGLTLQALGQDEDALEAFAQAASLTPDPRSPQVNRATLLMQLGRREEAQTILADIVSAQPDSAAAWYNLAEAKTFQRRDPDIAVMDEVLRGRLGYVDRIFMHYALGKAYDDIGDAETAFSQWSAGSRMKRAVIAYDSERKLASMDAIAAAFTPDLIARFTHIEQPSKKPIFILGMPRSGTTLIEQILASHPAVHGAGELPYFQQAVDAISGPSPDRSYPDILGRLTPMDIGNLSSHYLSQVSTLSRDAERIVDKGLINFLYAGLIHLVFPNAHLIHCRRDPTATCLSCYSKLFTEGQEFSYDLTELGLYYTGYRQLMAHWRSTLPRTSFFEIDYEAVVEDLETHARALIEFCGLPWHPACLRFNETSRPVRTASLNQVRQPLFRTGITRWNAYLPYATPLLDALGEAP